MDEFELEDNLEFILQSIQELIEDQGENNPFGEVNQNELLANLVNYDQDNLMPDVSVEDVVNGKDVQGIPWEKMLFPRDQYREMKMKGYKNYQNLSYAREDALQDCKQVERDGPYYDFQYNTRRARLSIVHFQLQLRNLVWATTKHDVYTVHNQSMTHWSSLNQISTELINGDDCIIPKQRGHGSQSVSMVQFTTMAVDNDLLVVGGFHGELICKRLEDDGIVFSTRVTDDENAITNSLEIYQDPNGSRRLVVANNDCSVRIFDTKYFDLLNHYVFPWSVNSVSVNPDGTLFAVLGDHEDGLVVDPKCGKPIGKVRGHLDYSFSSAWHPDGNILATGSQDTTCRLWDIRNLSQSLAVLGGRLGSIRCIKFSSDGRFLATAEPIDFVHIYDCFADYGKSHEIDFFGEIAGLSFSPDTEAFYIGVADQTYGGLMEFKRRHQHHYLNCLW
ncbi:uncharacterized WD repeat-containing protein C2A9.03 isoform X2 [Aegilops tauschii subsp. strangulata]|uniref:Uncharacterized protein n=3 Tax=Aegilops tauschii subsp. strangulata TaxID=200361 RepID=A0A453RVV9_AEGTS|nr:uncharacterized WD repeat-containing protein C2A9.03 isoform X2 [Aegilops tauschii subsp. strangulata]XP_044442377.1 uncharacterized WD repeat-containing protein C2A9.03-like isoform X1 [Triticum aestivum]XP_044442378.1 uncharacterized WD repeat-containing protein C2A9.03-like isoform X1 [Triticum aestivum]XP_044442380.1 uncharacterized WD repeat-containing protein C2A9.03-like isoform X1 [Triticum aestivum]XP_044442381.1 uncharacterized WD repeat-containing protein C2A9.03-like isoform X1 [